MNPLKLFLKISALVLLGLLISCSKKGETGSVGESITLTATVADPGTDLEYHWEILAQPEASWISIDKAVFSADFSTLTFIPDEPGEYSFKVTVSQYGDEVSSQSFTYTIESREESEENGVNLAEEERQEITEEEWLATPPSEPAAMVVPEPAPVVKPVKKPTPPPTGSAAEKTSQNPAKAGVSPGSSIPFDKKHYTIQVASKSTLKDAEVVASDLIEAGFDAYIQKAYFKENNQVWYRVRVGSYDDITIARTVSASIADTHHLSTWIDFVRTEQ